MELWKFVVLTYLSVVIIEAIPSLNNLAEDGNTSDYDDYVEGTARHAAKNSTGTLSLFQRWKERRKSTLPPELFTTTAIPAGSLADLNLRIAALEEKVNNLYNAVLLEEQQIAAMAQQIESMSSVLNAVFNAVISGTG